MGRVRQIAVFFVFLLAVAPARAESVRVVASIVPVHALVAGVMDGVGQPTLLVPGGGSPHTAVLRPSQARALQDADVVFWIGKGMETFLERPLATLSPEARVVALQAASGVILLSTRDDGDAHDGDARDDDAHDHDHAVDLHVWLDPANARAIVGEVAATLGKVDPANAARYRANGAALDARMAALDSELARVLTPLAGRPYVVFHDAYRYLERRYGLTPAAAITVSPDRKPGAATLRRVRAEIVATGAACVFAEPQFDPGIVETVVAGTGARTGMLDPLGTGLAPGVDAYFALMRNLAGALNACLRPSG